MDIVVAEDRGPHVDEGPHLGGEIDERSSCSDGFRRRAHVFEPNQAVAKGAAIYAQKLMIGDRIRTEIFRVMDRPADEVNLDDVPESVRDQAKQTVADSIGLRVDVLDKIDRMNVTNVASHSFGIVIEVIRAVVETSRGISDEEMEEAMARSQSVTVSG